MSRTTVVLPAYIPPVTLESLRRLGIQVDEPTPYQTIGKLPRGWRPYCPPNSSHFAFCDGGMVKRVLIYPGAVFALQSIDLIGTRPPQQKLHLPALEILPRYVVHEDGEHFHVLDRATSEMPAGCLTWQSHELAQEELNQRFPGSSPDDPEYDPAAYWQEWDDRNRPPRWFKLRQQLRQL